MGERTVVRFVSGPAEAAADGCVYIHWGGTADTMEVLFEEFFDRNEHDNERSKDFRYDDSPYLAARFIVHLGVRQYDEDLEGHPVLDMTGVGVVPDDPLDFAAQGFWLYTVVCGPGKSKRPTVYYHDFMTVPSEEEGGQPSIVWQNLVPLREAAEKEQA